MKTPERRPSITSDDLRLLHAELRPEDVTKYQTYLDATRTGLDYVRLSTEEQKQVRRAVENPCETLAGPEVLLWNNIRRSPKTHLRF